MKPARPLTASLLMLTAIVATAAAEPATFKIDASHSTVGFTIRHFFSRVPGSFNQMEGAFVYDDKNVAASSVNVTIQTASIFTNNERRDNHLRTGDFFLADSFPTITFKSTKVTPAEGGKFKIAGDLTMRGVTRPVTLDATFLGMGAVGSGGRSAVRAGFEATTTVNRKDWGIVWNRALDQGGTMLGDDVSIAIGIEAIKEDPNAPPPSQPAATPAPVKK